MVGIAACEHAAKQLSRLGIPALHPPPRTGVPCVTVQYRAATAGALQGAIQGPAFPRKRRFVIKDHESSVGCTVRHTRCLRGVLKSKRR